MLPYYLNAGNNFEKKFNQKVQLLIKIRSDYSIFIFSIEFADPIWPLFGLSLS